jgi:tripeptidyl-peptidase I
MFSSFFFTASLLLLATAKPLLWPYTIHEKRHHLPPGWSLVRRHDSSSILPLRFGLTQSNLHKLDEFLNDVAHPDSPNYSNHWSPERVAETFAPSIETVGAVRSWLADNGFDRSRVRVAPTRLWIQVNATVEEAERLLRAEYYVYRHDSGKEHIGPYSAHRCLPSLMSYFSS